MMNKLKNFLLLILDLILPKETEVIEIENMLEKDIFDKLPQANDLKNDKFKALFHYKDKTVRKIIWEIKYNKNEKIIKKVSQLLYELILENISEEMLFGSFDNPVFVPIPMCKNNLKERGYNQSELLVKEITRIDNAKIFTLALDTVTKIKETPHQSSLKNKTERLKNLKNCFCANEKLAKNRNIILIDDVITTGTTMNEVAKTLKKAGAKKVIGFSLAH